METQTETPRKRSFDLFVIGIVLGVTLLLITGAITASLLRQPEQLLPENSPAGTVQRFYLAVEQNDFNAAYDLLSDSMARKPSREEFAERVGSRYSYNYNRTIPRVSLESEKIDGDRAVVVVSIVFTRSNPTFPFGSSNTSIRQTYSLQREQNSWRITAIPDNFYVFY